MKHIIVPIDFSEESVNGLRMALIFANKFKARLQMVYVQKFPSDLGRVGFEEEKRKVDIEFKKLIDEFSPKFHDGDKLEFIVKKGKIYREIVNQAQAFEDSVIVSSTHGASGFEEFFMGSNSFKIVSAAENPVITIRHGAVPREIKTIILPIDSSVETRQKVPLTAEIAKMFEAEVHVLGLSVTKSEDIDTKIEAYTKQTCDYLKERDIKHVKHRLVAENMVNATIDYALDVEANLISIMTEQNGCITDFVLGSFAQQMLNKSPVPVLSITPKDVFIAGTFRTSGASY